jgi:phosphoribosyl-AMP cyclohydrolase
VNTTSVAAVPNGRPYRRVPIDLPNLTYNSDGLVPAVIQQYDTGEVLMIVYMNEAAILLTLHSQTLWFWSRSKGRLWNKGAKNENTKDVIDVCFDCGGGALLVAVDAAGASCHTNNRSCFYRSLFRTDRLREANPALIKPTAYRPAPSAPSLATELEARS